MENKNKQQQNTHTKTENNDNPHKPVRNKRLCMQFGDSCILCGANSQHTHARVSGEKGWLQAPSSLIFNFSEICKKK